MLYRHQRSSRMARRFSGTALAEVYRYVLQDAQIDEDIRHLMETLSAPAQSILVAVPEHTMRCAHLPWAHWFADGPELMAHPYDVDLEGHLAANHVPSPPVDRKPLQSMSNRRCALRSRTGHIKGSANGNRVHDCVNA